MIFYCIQCKYMSLSLYEFLGWKTSEEYLAKCQEAEHGHKSLSCKYN